MPFIGNQPALSYTSFAKQDFTTSATTSYTLDQPVANENELALFINFVRQEPTTAYTASGTTLTLTSATSASDDMYCVFLGKAVQTVNPPNGSVDSSKINYPLTTFSSTGIDDNASGNAITIESSKRVQFTRARSNTLGDSALEILPSDTVAGIGFRMENTNNDLVIEKSSPSGSEAEILRIRIGGGIALGGTGDANTLDDYEEGTFTPTFTSTGASFSYSNQYGFYTKIGRSVTCHIFIRAQSSGTTSNQLFISNFPFTSLNTNGLYSSASFGQLQSVDYLTGKDIVGHISPNSTQMSFQKTQDNGGALSLAASAIDGTTSSGFMVSINYFTDA